MKKVKCGDVYGEMIVIDVDNTNKSRIRVKLQCTICGRIKSIGSSALYRGSGQSHLGCAMSLRRNCPPEDKKRLEHFARVYHTAEQRCNNPNVADYARYGGRGIRMKFRDFVEFYDTMWETYIDGLTLDRINNEGDYMPSNCRWATRQQQARNRRTNRAIHVRNIHTGEENDFDTVSAFIEYYKLPSAAKGNTSNIIDVPNRSCYGWILTSR